MKYILNIYMFIIIFMVVIYDTFNEFEYYYTLVCLYSNNTFEFILYNVYQFYINFFIFLLDLYSIFNNQLPGQNVNAPITNSGRDFGILVFLVFYIIYLLNKYL